MGVHFKRLVVRKWRDRVEPILQGIPPKLLGFLEVHPIRTLKVLDRLRGRFGEDLVGHFDRQTNTLSVVAWSAGPFLGHLTPGLSAFAADAASSELEAVQRVLVHELGHHLLHVAGQRGMRLVYRAASSPRVKFITGYASESELEYFAECFSVYVYHRKQLWNYDRTGYTMVRNVLRMLEVDL